MKVINNQWQLSSAICLLIITLLTPFPLTGLKVAVTEPSQASLKCRSFFFSFQHWTLCGYFKWQTNRNLQEMFVPLVST